MFTPIWQEDCPSDSYCSDGLKQPNERNVMFTAIYIWNFRGPGSVFGKNPRSGKSSCRGVEQFLRWESWASFHQWCFTPHRPLGLLLWGPASPHCWNKALFCEASGMGVDGVFLASEPKKGVSRNSRGISGFLGGWCFFNTLRKEHGTSKLDQAMSFWCSEISLPRDAINLCFISKKQQHGNFAWKLEEASWICRGHKSLNSWTSLFWGASRCSLFSPPKPATFTEDAPDEAAETAEEAETEIGMRPGFWNGGLEMVGMSMCYFLNLLSTEFFVYTAHNSLQITQIRVYLTVCVCTNE